MRKNWQYFSSRIYQILQQNAIPVKLYFLLLELNEDAVDIFGDFIINYDYRYVVNEIDETDQETCQG